MISLLLLLILLSGLLEDPVPKGCKIIYAVLLVLSKSFNTFTHEDEKNRAQKEQQLPFKNKSFNYRK